MIYVGVTFRERLEVLRKRGFLAFLKETSHYVLSRLFGYVLILLVLRKFRGLIGSVVEVDRAVDFASSFECLGFSIRPLQNRGEIMKLLKIVDRVKPNAVLEIGTANGGTLFLFTRAADHKAKIISIDLPGGFFSGGYPKWRIPLYRSFARDEQKIYLIRADSHDVDTLKEIKRILGDCKIDFLFIDGDHSYRGINRDFGMYSPLVKKGGIIAFHDIVPGSEKYVGGVPRFWSKIKNHHSHLEAVGSWEQGGGGIGILFV